MNLLDFLVILIFCNFTLSVLSKTLSVLCVKKDDSYRLLKNWLPTNCTNTHQNYLLFYPFPRWNLIRCPNTDQLCLHSHIKSLNSLCISIAPFRIARELKSYAMHSSASESMHANQPNLWWASSFIFPEHNPVSQCLADSLGRIKPLLHSRTSQPVIYYRGRGRWTD